MSEAARREIPREKGVPLLGSAAGMAAGPHRFVADVARRHGGLAAFRVLHKKFIAVSDADYIRHILVTEGQRYRRSYHYDNPVLGAGLLSTDGPHWLARRRQVNAAFRRDTLERLVPVAHEETERMIARWDRAAQAGEPVELVHEMQQLTVSIIGRSLLSTALNAADAARFATTVREAARFMRRRNNSLFIAPLWAPTPVSRGLRRTRDVLDAFLEPIIAERRAERRASPSVRRDLLDALLAVRDPDSGDALDDQAVLDEAKTLFAAGFETTATALSWTLYLLARNAPAAAEWHAELDRELDGRAPEWADLARLPHLGRVVSESLRLYPPVYNLARVCVEEDSLDGYRIPVGTVLLLSVLGAHHDPRHWPEPDAFRPERFAGEWQRHAYLPFATGQHVCIGNNFSLTEMAVVLAAIGQRFRIEPVDDRPVDAIANVTLLPAREIPVRLIAR